MRKKLLCMVLCAAVASAAFAGCQKSSDGGTDENRGMDGNHSADTEASSEDLAGKEGKTDFSTETNVDVEANGTYAVIVRSAGDPDGEKEAEGFRRAVEAAGGTCVIKEPATEAAEDQVAAVNQCVSQCVDAIAISVTDAEALQAALQAALNLDIHVVGFDSPLNADSRELFVRREEGDDPEKVGQLCAYAAVALVNGTITGAEGETLAAGELGECTVVAASDGGTEIAISASSE